MDFIIKANTQQFHANGSERMRITSDGQIYHYLYDRWFASNGSTTVGYIGRANQMNAGGSDTDFSIASAANNLTFVTNSNERMRLTSSGYLGIGTTSPSGVLDVRFAGRQGINLGSTNGGGVYIVLDGAGNGDGAGGDYAWIEHHHTSGDLSIGTGSSSAGSSEKFRIADTGEVMIGTTTAASNCQLTIRNTNAQLALYSNPTGDSVLHLGDTDNHSDGQIAYSNSSGFLKFVTRDSERMRIDSSGNVLIGKTSSGIGNAGIELLSGAQFAMFTTNGSIPVYVNRTSNDGTLISLQGQSTQEGSISVSGTTVSYNGAHLARWSQLPGGAERTEILRGTVLSNIDEMCEWGEEDNEQLNRMKVSDVEGDKNVSGVFQAWDDDDDTYVNDFYCAMTGDFVIRIAQGTTVARGDLLMSAGDGTSKPQDDDIVRSKTIAKVTSTTVSATYADNSYCVPCVLMTC